MSCHFPGFNGFCGFRYEPQINADKYLAIYFQVFAYEYPQMNADKRRCLSAADSSAFIRVHPRSVKAVFPRKNPGKLLAGYLNADEHIRPVREHQRFAGISLMQPQNPLEPVISPKMKS